MCAERIMVTGSAGFIGFHTAKKLLDIGYEVAGVDNLNSGCDAALQNARLMQLKAYRRYIHHDIDLTHPHAVLDVFRAYSPEYVVHLAAQVGVRNSFKEPQLYIENNITAFANILEACRHKKVQHLVYASSSAVYGASKDLPFIASQPTETPISLYAVTKKTNELMAHAYAHSFKIPVTGLRFFTVYGPWGRPDMAYFSFSDAIMEGKPITLYHNGNMQRDFTYVDDIVSAIAAVLPCVPNEDVPYAIYNIGNNQPVSLAHFVALLETYLGREAIIEYLPLQTGDMVQTWADISGLQSLTGYAPKTSIEDGLSIFCSWFMDWRRRSENTTRSVIVGS